MLKNVAANVLGRFWSILSNYLFVPAYIAILGIESYSIISFSLVLVGFMAILDSGLTATISREFASRRTTVDHKLRVFHTLESCYFLIATLVIALFLLFSGTVATNWLKLEAGAVPEVTLYLRILGVGAALQLMGNFYVGGLLGLERQIVANVYQVAWSVARNGLVIVLLLARPSLSVFFAWQAITTLGYVLAARHKLLSLLGDGLPFTPQLRIERRILDEVWKFAAGMFAIAIVASINTQVDKLVLSKLLDIVELGYYSLATALAQGLLIVVSSISVATLPRFTQLYSVRAEADAAELYRQVLLGISILVFTIALVVAFHAREILWVWTGDPEIAAKAAPSVPYLMIGSALLALQVVPFNLAMAHGQTKINNVMGVLSLTVTIPAYIILIGRRGAIGAAIVWMALNLVGTPIYFLLIHRKFLREQMIWRHYVSNVGLPLVVAGIVSFVAASIRIPGMNRLATLAWLGAVTLINLGIGIVVFIPPTTYRAIFRPLTGGAR